MGNALLALVKLGCRAGRGADAAQVGNGIGADLDDGGTARTSGTNKVKGALDEVALGAAGRQRNVNLVLSDILGGSSIGQDSEAGSDDGGELHGCDGNVKRAKDYSRFGALGDYE